MSRFSYSTQSGSKAQPSNGGATPSPQWWVAPAAGGDKGAGERERQAQRRRTRWGARAARGVLDAAPQEGGASKHRAARLPPRSPGSFAAAATIVRTAS